MMRALPTFILPFCALTLPAVAAPLVAQTPVQTPAPAQPVERPVAITTIAGINIPVEQVKAAKPVVDKLWPLGTYRKMMDSQMGEIIKTMLEPLGGPAEADLFPERDAGDGAKAKTYEERMIEADPHYKERSRIMTDVIFKELRPFVDKSEPAVRDALIASYARKFTVSQLAELDRYLGTPSGQVFAQHWMTSFSEPEMVNAMESFIPELSNAMPAIMDKYEAATAHLPKTKSTLDIASDAAAEAADAPFVEKESNPENKWTQADRKSAAKLDNEIIRMSGTLDTLYVSRELHALDAKARSGQKLSDDEMAMRDYLRSELKGKK